MIARLSGTLVEKLADAAVVDVNGVGYYVHVSLQSMAKLPAVGQRVTLRTHTHVREDALQLFGFAAAEEEQLFHLLIDVSGVGPRLASTILSGMPAGELAKAIVGNELARLTKIQGVGKKTAERLVVELKDKLVKLGLTARLPAEIAAGEGGALLSALLNLGYKQASAERAAESARKALGETAPLEELVKEALRAIGRSA